MIFVSTTLYSQQVESVLRVVEVDRDGKYRTAQNEIRESYVNNKVSDINSTLHIQITVEDLLDKVKGLDLQGLGLPSDIISKINKLSVALEERNKVLSQFKILLEEYDYRKFKANSLLNKEWVSTMQQLVAPVEALTQIDPYIEEGPGGFRPEDIYARTSIVLNRMRAEVQITAQEEGVYLQLGAWLYSKREPLPLHLPGFDIIEPQESYEVERWQILPTKEQVAALKQLNEIAAKNRNQDLSLIKKYIETEIDRIKELLFLDSKSLFENLEAALENIDHPNYKAIQSQIKELVIDFKFFIKTIEQKLKFYQNLSLDSKEAIISVVNQIEEDLIYITEQEGKQLVLKFVNTYENLKKLGQDTEEIAKLGEELTKIITTYTSWLEIVSQDSLFKNIKSLLRGVEVDFEALQFSDEVLNLMLSEVPKDTELDLYTAGIRQQGDRILFKLLLRAPTKEIYQETREIYLYKVLPHIEGTVGVVFADPLSRTAIETQFQMAPYYNMLLKGVFDQKLRRQSVAYNRIFDWGIGLHISAPDFDGDDVPELGTGIVVSALHDYLQTGLAINVFTGDPYWFFGLRLPVPSFSISGLSN
ncbi:hypothetical protein [Aquimarina intermedia]|uniref:hypothetical protein n=1 Tax=Aquimarina intermedia TaxID=350814 RepID=UPI0011E72AD5|nr:hypothetical protein [Aquimarina intermedia]